MLDAGARVQYGEHTGSRDEHTVPMARAGACQIRW